MAESDVNPKTLQYLTGHSDIGVVLSTYANLGLEDAQDELSRIAEIENARRGKWTSTAGRKRRKCSG